MFILSLFSPSTLHSTPITELNDRRLDFGCWQLNATISCKTSTAGRSSFLHLCHTHLSYFSTQDSVFERYGKSFFKLFNQYLLIIRSYSRARICQDFNAGHCKAVFFISEKGFRSSGFLRLCYRQSEAWSSKTPWSWARQRGNSGQNRLWILRPVVPFRLPYFLLCYSSR